MFRFKGAPADVSAIDERGDADRAALGGPPQHDLGEGILEVDAPSILAELEAGRALASIAGRAPRARRCRQSTLFRSPDVERLPLGDLR